MTTFGMLNEGGQHLTKSLNIQIKKNDNNHKLIQ